MNIEIALAPDLEIDPQQFVRQWNADAECTDISTAECEQRAGTFDPVSVGAVAVLAGIAAGITVNVVSKLVEKAIDRLCDKQAAGRQIRIATHAQPDGTTTLVITIDES